MSKCVKSVMSVFCVILFFQSQLLACCMSPEAKLIRDVVNIVISNDTSFNYKDVSDKVNTVLNDAGVIMEKVFPIQRKIIINCHKYTKEEAAEKIAKKILKYDKKGSKDITDSAKTKSQTNFLDIANEILDIVK